MSTLPLVIVIGTHIFRLCYMCSPSFMLCRNLKYKKLLIVDIIYVLNFFIIGFLYIPAKILSHDETEVSADREIDILMLCSCLNSWWSNHNLQDSECNTSPGERLTIVLYSEIFCTLCLESCFVYVMPLWTLIILSTLSYLILSRSLQNWRNVTQN